MGASEETKNKSERLTEYHKRRFLLMFCGEAGFLECHLYRFHPVLNGCHVLFGRRDVLHGMSFILFHFFDFNISIGCLAL